VDIIVIEKYLSNPAANEFIYVVQDILTAVICRFVSCIANCFTVSLENVTLFIYRGAVTSYNVSNNPAALYAHRFYNSPIVNYWLNPCDIMFVMLPPGTYTFAANVGTDVANFKMNWFLSG